MIEKISIRLTANLCIILYSAFMIFHILLIILAGILDRIPYNMVWGGSIKSRQQLIIFEIISLVLMGGFLFLTLVKTGYVQITALSATTGFAMWVLFIYFLLNTVMNILAKTALEKTFSIATLLLSLCSLRLALEKAGN